MVVAVTIWRGDGGGGVAVTIRGSRRWYGSGGAAVWRWWRRITVVVVVVDAIVFTCATGTLIGKRETPPSSHEPSRNESSHYDIMSLGRPSFSAARSYVFRGTIVRLLCQRPATYNDASQWSEISPAPSARGSARRTWGPRSRPSAGSCRAARSRRNRSASTPRRNTVGGGIAPNKIKQTHQRQTDDQIVRSVDRQQTTQTN